MSIRREGKTQVVSEHSEDLCVANCPLSKLETVSRNMSHPFGFKSWK